MRLRTFTVSLIAAALTTLPLAGVAAAHPPGDCPKFDSQAEAQAALDSGAGDAKRLDADGNGVACEHFDFSSSAPTTTAAPTTTPAPDDAAGEAPPAAPPAAPPPAGEAPPAAPPPAGEAPPAAQPPADDDAGEAPPVTRAPADDDDQVSVIPRGGVETGDGSSTDGTPAPLLIGAALVLAGVTAAARRRAHNAR